MRLLCSYWIISAKHIYICIFFYSYNRRIGTDENNMKIKMWSVLLTTIGKARNHYQDVDHCHDEGHCHILANFWSGEIGTGNINH